jgi:O-antigen/teichoic acid export membrane protein
MAVLTELVAPERMSVRAKLVRNVLFSGAQNLFLLPIGFLLVPFTLGKIGTQAYGSWAVLLTIVNLTGITDLGLGGTLTKQVAHCDAKSGPDAMEHLLNTALAIYLCLAIVITAVLLFASRYAISLMFRGSTPGPGVVSHLWRYLILMIGLNIVSMPLYSVLGGLQRGDLSAICAVLSTVSRATLTVVFLVLGWGLSGLMAAYVVTTGLMVVVLVWTAHHLLPHVRLNPWSFRWSLVSEIFGFSLKLYVIQVALMIQNQVEKLYLASFIGVVPVGWYNIAGDVGQRFRSIPGLLLGPVMAAASNLDAVGDKRRVEELYRRSHKYLAFLGVPGALFISAYAGRFVDLWLGPAFGMVAFPLVVLVWVNFLNLITGPGVLILTGEGSLKIPINATLVSVFLILTTSLALIYRFGFSGAVFGILAATLLSTCLFFYWFDRDTGYSIVDVARQAYLKPAACSAGILLAMRFIAPAKHLGWGGLVLHGSIFGMLYLLLILKTRFLDSFDLAQVKGLSPLLRLARKFVPAD